MACEYSHRWLNAGLLFSSHTQHHNYCRICHACRHRYSWAPLLKRFIYLLNGRREHLLLATVHTAPFSHCLSSRTVKQALWLQNLCFLASVFWWIALHLQSSLMMNSHRAQSHTGPEVAQSFFRGGFPAEVLERHCKCTPLGTFAQMHSFLSIPCVRVTWHMFKSSFDVHNLKKCCGFNGHFTVARTS